MSYPDESPRPVSLERRRANRRSITAERSRSRARAAQKIDDALAAIHRNWPFMTSDQCVPVKVALSLLDSSSLGLGHREHEFAEMHERLQHALKVIVNEHHQAFNSAIGTFHGIQESIAASQARIVDLKRSLVLARGRLGAPKAELAELAAASAAHGEMLEMLTEIEKAKAVPAELEEMVGAKRFLRAVDVLQAGLRTVRSSEFSGIGALADLRVYLGNQEHGLGEILTEELNSLLYPDAADQDGSPNGPKPAGTAVTGPKGTRRALISFLDRLDRSDGLLTEDPSGEAGRFDSIRQAVQAVYNLGRLEMAVDSVRDRMAAELRRAVDKSVLEVARRNPGSMAGTAGVRLSTEIDPTFALRKVVLVDLMNTVYGRFEAIAETHRALHASIASILDHDAKNTAATISRPSAELLAGLSDLCGLFESEMRALFLDYLTVDKKGPVKEAGDGLVGTRDRTRKLFEIGAVDSKQAAAHRDALETVMKATVPGLSVRDTAGDGPRSVPTAARPALLVAPGVFNMRVLLPASMEFAARLGDVVPAHLSDSVRRAVESFLEGLFLPLMDDSVAELAGLVMTDGSPFEQDRDWAARAGHPIFRGASLFFAVADGFCRMLDELAEYSDFGGGEVVARHVAGFYDRCAGWVSVVMAGGVGGGGSLRLARELAETERRAWMADAGGPDGSFVDLGLALTAEQVEQETLRLSARLQGPIGPGDIQLNPKVIASLCVMHNSMSWIAAKLENQSRGDRDGAGDGDENPTTKLFHTLLEHQQAALAAAAGATSSGPHSRKQSTSHARTGSTKSIPKLSSSAVLGPAFAALAGQIVRVLRYEVRAHVGYFVHQFTDPARRPFVLDRPVGRADPEATALAHDLSGLDEQVELLLPARAHEFVMCALVPFVDRVVVEKVVAAAAMNENGCGRMQLDVLVLQQNMAVLSAAVAATCCPVTPGGGGGRGSADHRADGSDPLRRARSRSRSRSRSRARARSPARPAFASLAGAADVLDLFLAGPEAVAARVEAAAGGGERLPAGMGPAEAESLIRLSLSEELGCGEREREYGAGIRLERAVGRVRHAVGRA